MKGGGLRGVGGVRDPVRQPFESFVRKFRLEWLRCTRWHFTPSPLLHCSFEHNNNCCCNGTVTKPFFLFLFFFSRMRSDSSLSTRIQWWEFGAITPATRRLTSHAPLSTTTCPAVYHPMPRCLPPHAPLSTTPCPAGYHPMPRCLPPRALLPTTSCPAVYHSMPRCLSPHTPLSITPCSTVYDVKAAGAYTCAHPCQ